MLAFLRTGISRALGMPDSYFAAIGCALLGPRLGVGLIFLEVFGFPFP